MKFKVYQDGEGDGRWRLVSKNGRIVADSAEGYQTEQNLQRALRTLQGADIANAKIEVVRK